MGGNKMRETEKAIGQFRNPKVNESGEYFFFRKRSVCCILSCLIISWLVCT